MPFAGRTIDAILFDIDGTIADTDDAAVARLERWFGYLPFVLRDRDPHRAARRVTMRLESPVNALLAWLDRSGLDQFLGPLMDGFHSLRGIAGHSHARLIPGVHDALIRLAEHYPLGIVTAREQRSAFAILEAHGLASLFRCVATARTTLRAKPHPDPILWAIHAIGTSPERCIMVGDTTPDIRAGKSAGLLTVGVLCGFGERDELEEAGADIILDSTAALAGLLLGA